ncbi:unnamed protein product (macronuclear) [Paramecium tetraurelia]|uniref:Uncharacterized protein n=1 Tax=Paramecium tetraurelia TaxID=5888 RepID=A0DM16_PARTE|nr:uncharacterized protein GSPATT00018301001 [Paramecium tetraurelia]CAK84083.1 unnamed protein product [Paramecium tetraurelia]|eukprot:XP_001451480.1 hypothetical protein (macronuclear) [Paramecium tetraurelia strain d4-2]
MIKKLNKRSNLQSAPEIIRTRQKPHSDLEIENLVMQDIRKKILNDEMNTIQFYDIVQPDQDEMIATLKDSQKKPIKLHRRVQRTDLESKLRARISNEPGSKLLLQEIYEKLEEDPGKNAIPIHKKLHQEEQLKVDLRYKPESEDQLVANLDQWYKGIKRKRKQHQDQLRQEQENERLTKAQMQERTQSLIQQRRGGLNDKTKPIQSTSSFPKLLIDSAKTENEQSTFKQKLLGSLKKITAIKKIETLHQDPSLNKQLDKYLQQGSNLTKQELAQIEQAKAKQYGDDQNNGTLIFDYTVEGLKSSLHTMIKMQFTSFQNASDRAIFYEKQTNQILLSINQRLDRQKNTVKRNEKDLEILRIENHEIHKKLRGIQDFLKERKEELIGINKKPQQSINSPNIKHNSSQVDNYMVIAIKQNELEAQIEQMKDNYNNFSEQMKLNSMQIEKLEQENSKLNKNNKTLLKSIQGFLLELLKLGLDCRSQGLSWIIKAIWDSGEKIADSNFPTYLDSKARDFLFIRAKKTIELNDLYKKAHFLFRNYRDTTIDTGNNSVVSLLSKNYFSQIDSIEIKKQHIDQIKQRQQNNVALLTEGLSPTEHKLIEKAFTQIFQSKETQNDIIYLEASRKISKMFKQEGSQEQSIVFSEINNFEKDRLIKEYQQIQKDIEMKENQFQKLEETELQRLIKEIDYKNYLARFNIEALQVLAAQFGYQKAERELIKYGLLHKIVNN